MGTMTGANVWERNVASRRGGRIVEKSSDKHSKHIIHDTKQIVNLDKRKKAARKEEDCKQHSKQII